MQRRNTYALYCNFKIENQRGKMGLNASDVSRINPTLS